MEDLRTLSYEELHQKVRQILRRRVRYSWQHCARAFKKHFWFARPNYEVELMRNASTATLACREFKSDVKQCKQASKLEK
jgi:hypothetical protein